MAEIKSTLTKTIVTFVVRGKESQNISHGCIILWACSHATFSPQPSHNRGNISILQMRKPWVWEVKQLSCLAHSLLLVDSRPSIKHILFFQSRGSSLLYTSPTPHLYLRGSHYVWRKSGIEHSLIVNKTPNWNTDCALWIERMLITFILGPRRGKLARCFWLKWEGTPLFFLINFT